jgi:hypothetical protein
MLVTLALMAVLSFVGAIALRFPLHSAAHIHLALALGIMPLIYGAMTHFVPVLTRSAEAPPGVRLMPLLLSGAGALAFFPLPHHTRTIISPHGLHSRCRWHSPHGSSGAPQKPSVSRTRVYTGI